MINIHTNIHSVQFKKTTLLKQWEEDEQRKKQTNSNKQASITHTSNTSFSHRLSPIATMESITHSLWKGSRNTECAFFRY